MCIRDRLIADFVVSYFSDPYILFGVLMLVTGILTNIMSNTATTAIMVPLVIPIALGMNLSPLPFVMGIAMSAAACYMTPIATPSNTLVLRPGNYTFGDCLLYTSPDVSHRGHGPRRGCGAHHGRPF